MLGRRYTIKSNQRYYDDSDVHKVLNLKEQSPGDVKNETS